VKREAFAALIKKRGSSGMFLAGTIIFTLLTALCITVTGISSPIYAVFSVPNAFICAGLWSVFAQCGSKRVFKIKGLVYIKAVFLVYTAFLFLAVLAVSSSMFSYLFIFLFRLTELGNILYAFGIFAALLAVSIHGISVITALNAITPTKRLPAKITPFMPIMSIIAAAVYCFAEATLFPRWFNVAAAVLNAAASVILTVSFLKFRKDYKKI